jgi:hypothetical protein
VLFHLAQGEGQHRLERRVGRRTEREIVGLDVADGPFPFSPTNEEQCGPVATGGVRLVVRPRGDRVRLAIGAAEGRRALVDLLIAAEGRIVDYFRRKDSFTTLPTMNTMLAGRSARRRIRYGYQWVPNGTYTRTL